MVRQLRRPGTLFIYMYCGIYIGDTGDVLPRSDSITPQPHRPPPSTSQTHTNTTPHPHPPITSPQQNHQHTNTNTNKTTPQPQAFLSAVVRDEAYLAQTWEVTAPWNRSLRAELAARFPDWKVHGEEYLSWVWVRGVALRRVLRV